MKQLITIIGPNGVGKSTTAGIIVDKYKRTAYVDADWCRVINPFKLTEATKQTVTENIYCLLQNYLLCDDIDMVVFPYAWHGERKEIYDKVMAKLRGKSIDFKENIFILKCTKEENIKRAITDGRDEERVKRGIENTFSFYDQFDYTCIDTTNMKPQQVAEKINSLI